MPSKRFALFITARLGSKRLPNKHLLDLGEIRPIEILIRRLKKLNLPIVLTTGNEEINYGFKDLCKKEGIELFFGDATNIPKRHLEAARELNYDFIFSIDGDDILTAPEGVKAILNKIENADYSNGFYHTDGYPFGVNSGGYSRIFLENALKEFTGNSLETGWGRIFPKNSFVAVSCPSKNAENWRLSLDYNEDLIVFKSIWDHFQNSLFEASTDEILEYFFKNELWKLNGHIIEKYWENFHAERNKEIKKETK
ncbi:hypothetical protein SHI21_10420 [Bacteriovorax sp. PP10]|uniref:Spore coat polysaccharide biosynthesis protein SpsF n=1 Tax=Bacteriovorax antarcticus TaxID=3088717 RepID=A0ABU5VUL1_9BACT|nr:hypothetical protein [Bacteriovorax sp. PP10]MEA9356622.1 hypothetical protein [Bacteriovorax sp. PP10]